jgi:hypothetical protein
MDNLPSQITDFFSSQKKQLGNGDVALDSPQISFDFDDLGFFLREYVKEIDIPDTAGVDGIQNTYLQIVPHICTEQLRVYLDSELLEHLGRKGLGLDIHAQ